jgi:predicted DNA-binding antitoxin AbrB/MazE fold protein
MTTTTVTATFENGVLRPDEPLLLAEGTRVLLTIEVLDLEPVVITVAERQELPERDRQD